MAWPSDVTVSAIENILVFEAKANQSRMCVFSFARMTFCSCDLDLDRMTLIYELDLDIVKMYQATKLKFLGQGFRKLEHEQNSQTDRRTDRRDRTHYQPHSRVVKRYGEFTVLIRSDLEVQLIPLMSADRLQGRSNASRIHSRIQASFASPPSVSFPQSVTSPRILKPPEYQRI